MKTINLLRKHTHCSTHSPADFEVKNLCLRETGMSSKMKAKGTSAHGSIACSKQKHKGEITETLPEGRELSEQGLSLVFLPFWTNWP